MLTFGAVSFAAPWALLGLATLPVVWWLLRLLPPAPARIPFPPVAILARLTTQRESPARTPPWLLFLRLLLAALVILAAAEAIINAGSTLRGNGPVYVIVDNDWAAASDWNSRLDVMRGLSDQAERLGRPMVVLATAPTSSPVASRVPALMTAAEAKRLIEALRPQPWQTDRRTVIEGLLSSDAVKDVRPGDVIWLSNGIEEAGGGSEAPLLADLADDLRILGATVVLSGAAAELPVWLRLPKVESGSLEATVMRAQTGEKLVVPIRVFSDEGRLLAERGAAFKAAATEAPATIELPVELLNRIARLEAGDGRTVGGTVLLDENWRRRPVGIVSGEGVARDQPLLSDTHYLARALHPFAELRTGTANDLLKRELAVLVLSDPGRLGDKTAENIDNWLQRGGLVLRFAGPNLAEAVGAQEDALLPVALRAGDRIIGGAMSWSRPEPLAPFERSSPFFGLKVPADVRVRRQVLARPALDLNDKTWARLRDGTPLVTAERRGKGWLILMHTTANAEWSNLPLSGLFVEMLRRIVGLSQGVARDAEGPPLQPVATLDGFARLGAPAPGTRAISARGFADTRVTPQHPPGFYGSDSEKRALNLAAHLAPLQPIGTLPSGVERRGYETGGERDLRPWLLSAAFALFLLDAVISLALRGFLGGLRPAVVIAALVAGTAAHPLKADDQYYLGNSLETRLAYILTGDKDVDAVSERGLVGLNLVLKTRTAAELGPPQGVDPSVDDLSFFPLLYWPIVSDFRMPDDLTAIRISEFLRNGGTIIFDTRDQAGGAVMSSLGELARELDLPPLTPVPVDHVLARAFYLLNEFPGRFTGGTVWVERAGERVNDGVSPIIAGGHDWPTASASIW